MSRTLGTWSALVTDLTLPGGIDGVALVTKAQSLRPGLPAVLLTGFAGDGTGGVLAAGDAISHHCPLLRKPVSGVELVELIGALLVGCNTGT